jgi:Xaa-Pro aminopeptidase
MIANTERASQWLRSADLDALILTSPASVAYAAGHRVWIHSLMRDFMARPAGTAELAMPAFAVLPADGPPVIAAESFFLWDDLADDEIDLALYGTTGFDSPFPPAAGGLAAAHRVVAALERARGATSVVEAVRAALAQRGLTSGRLGIESDGLSASLQEQLVEALPAAQLLDCSQLVRLIRMVKTEDEISLLSRAAEVAERAGVAALEGIGPRTTAADVIDEFKARIGAGGADFDHFMYSVAGIGFGTKRTSRPMRECGSTIAVDWGCVYEGYFSDTGHSVLLDPSAGDLLAAHSVLAECVELGAGLLRPGNPASLPHLAMMEFLAEHDIRASFPHGHGIGLEVRDLPIIAAPVAKTIRDACVEVDADIEFEAGMVLNLEATILRPGEGGVEVERSFVLTADGCRPLVEQPRERPLTANGAG